MYPLSFIGVMGASRAGVIHVCAAVDARAFAIGWLGAQTGEFGNKCVPDAHSEFCIWNVVGCVSGLLAT